MTRLQEAQYIEYLAHMLDEAMLTEGKHWPKDYVKAAVNRVKASPLGQQDWYTDDMIAKDVNVIAADFNPIVDHQNQNRVYFNAVIRWLIEYSGTDVQRCAHFMSQKLDPLIGCIHLFVHSPALVDRYRDDVANSMSYEDFVKMMQPLVQKMKKDAQVDFNVEDKGYEIIPIMSYNDLHKQFGGPVTGYKGESEWCHTNGKSTYDSWTSNYTRFFFVIAKKNWKDIQPPDLTGIDTKTATFAYDEYGTSLMAILVSDECELMNCTLRWNHVINPANAKPGYTIDNAFISFAELSKVTGLDVEAEVTAAVAKLVEKFKDLPKGRLVYKDRRCKCYATDKLAWYSLKNKKIQPPDKIDGLFSCEGTSLTSLAGSPREVNNFYCSNTKITSLEGAPEKAITFDCSGTRITSLKGGPSDVKYYTCGGNPLTGLDDDSSRSQLTSFEGAPKTVDSFTCRNVQFSSLDIAGMPDVKYDLAIVGWPNLKSLHGIRSAKSIYVSKCPSLTSFAGCPDSIAGDFTSSENTSITSLEGCPKKIGEYLRCYNNNIHDFEGGPTSVGRYISITQEDNMTSLKGAPGKCNDVRVRSNKAASIDEVFPKEEINAYLKWKEEHGTADNSYPG